MKTNLNIKKRVSIVPIFTGLIFAGILGIRTATDSNHFFSNPNEKQNGSYTVNKEHISQLIMGAYHSSALTNEGNVYTWGSNYYGNLGDGTRDDKTTPTKITDNFHLSGDEKITQLSLGGEHSSALTNEGNVYTWGYNNYGNLGDGSTDYKTTPTKITAKFNLSGDEKISELSMGWNHSSVLTNEGNVYTWGNNKFGQIGDGTTDNKYTPTKITNNFHLSGEEKISELIMGTDHSSALTDKGNVYTWGYNGYGNLGNGTAEHKHTPTKITDKFNLSGDEKISQLSLNGEYSSALTNEGNVYTWGSNGNGQLGDGTNNDKNTPTKITDKFNLSGEEKISELSMGAYHSSALTNEGNVYTWGQNDNGELGDGTTDNKYTPTKITDNFNLSGEEKISELSMGALHSSALTNKGNVYTWGRNNYGQLGRKSTDGNISKSPGIVDIINFSFVRSVGVSNKTHNSVTINFTVTKNDQSGNVVIKDKDGAEKATRNALDGQNSITIDNLESNTTFTGWTIEVDGNGKVAIEDFTTLPIKSEVKFDDTTITTHDSVTINFTVTKNDQSGNVVIKDKDGAEKATRNGLDGQNSLTIDNLESKTTFTGWTIEVDGNGKVAIEDFTTLPIKSEVKFDDTTITTHDSVTINFTVTKNDQSGNVVIKDKDGAEKATRNGLDGQNSLTIDNLESKTTFTGWTIEVDGNGKVAIEDFTTLPLKSEVKFDDTTITTHDSVTINFTVTKNDQSGKVVIKDKDGAEKATRNALDGQNSITIDNLESNTTFTGWTIEVDGNGKVAIEDFTTLPLKSEVKFDDTTITTHDSVTINFTVTKNDQSGDVVIKDKDGAEKATRNALDGQNSITIDNLESNTTFTGWTIEVDGNGKVAIEDFTTLPFKSEVEFDNTTNITQNSVTINFTVTKNYQFGNVVIKDETGAEKATRNALDGQNSITIDNLKSKTTFTGWTIEVDGNGKVPIEDFKTKKYTSNDIENNLDLNIKGEIKSSDKEITLIYESNQQLNGIWQHTITYKNGEKQITSSSNGKYSVNNTIEKIYSLDQSIENIEKIETIYEIDGYDVLLDTYTGPADKVLVIKETKPGLSPGAITGIVLGSIMGVALIVLMIYFLTKKNRTKTQ